MPTKYRVHRWLNTKTDKEAFGIQGQRAFGKHYRYRHALASIDGAPTALIYEKESRAKEVCDQLNTGSVPSDLASGLITEVERKR